jgi:hypothetical protein
MAEETFVDSSLKERSHVQSQKDTEETLDFFNVKPPNRTTTERLNE